MKHINVAVFLALIFWASSVFSIEFDPEAFVTAHNHLRAAVGVNEKLSYSAELAASSQSWADKLKQSNQCRMRHSEPHGRYGENLYWASALRWSDGRKELQKKSPQHVVDNWGSEREYFNYAKNSCAAGKVCGHYTQAVWRNTQKVGCAVAVCEDTKEQVWVCQYQPAGNLVGKKPY